MFVKRSGFHIYAILLVALSMLALASPAQAATATVANCDDSGAGSLRQAVIDATAGDTINFGLDCPASGPITLASSISIEKNLTISGAGHQIVISGNNAKRIFNISYDMTVTLDYLTLKNALNDDGGHGGAIYDNGSYLTISHVTFDGNQAAGDATRDGGAIYHNTHGSLTISNSVFTNNSATRYGGAINTRIDTNITDSTFTGNSARGGALMTFVASTTITLERVTMNGNTAIGPGPSAGQGGALYVGFAALNIYNSTLSGNGSASYTNYGGAIYTYDSYVTIKNSTIVNNVIDTTDPGFTGGGIEINNAALNISNTILANNAVDDCHTSGGLVVDPNVNNLMEVSVGCGTPTLSSDPNLGALANNGGATQTHALLPGSPAIDAGANVYCLTTDQRGVSRSQGATCDIGAFELQAYTLTIVSANGTVAKNPDKTAYHEGDVVQLTAIPNANWSFVNWTGALTGSLNPGSVTIHGNTSVTANYARTVYTRTNYSSGAQDGWILESSESSNVGGSINSSAATFYLGDDKLKKQYRGILSFSTGSLPDTAVITGVTLKVKQQAITGGGNPVTIFGGFMADIKNGFFGTAALQTTDFQTAAGASGKTYGPFVLAPVSSWYSINLTGAKAYINKLATNSGLTQIRLRFKLDDNNNAIANYLSLYSGNAAGSQPQLVITYIVP